MNGPSTTAGQGVRRRDAQASRDAILRAARIMFARYPYTDITLKAVAERAGVSAPLIVKYFGNKERLFAHILSFEEDTEALLDAPLEDLGRHMVTHLLTSQAERNTAPVLRIAFAPLHSSHGEYGEVLRANFRRQVVARLTERLSGPDAAVRAELAMSMLLGLGIMYGIARGEAVRAADIADLADRYSPALQELLSGHR
ncbi:TetR/AcrR family transcriptional regulator [Streptomyces himalayensis]|uniref:TetR/AcrR family transcriptional regulator n=1 Tax=Streptomyces himalayensis subsp. himalayensis TaxID=2756131 RepID=A0A7W0ICM9_9ACTN|nr:TetR family transcriptional regulator [Streptomyces himalayensis]MBA2950552.1 TetR/AcrR family transcriptional regulator [Streptomyces himalayensis subsp. himalayensis]